MLSTHLNWVGKLRPASYLKREAWPRKSGKRSKTTGKTSTENRIQGNFRTWNLDMPRMAVLVSKMWSERAEPGWPHYIPYKTSHKLFSPPWHPRALNISPISQHFPKCALGKQKVLRKLIGISGNQFGNCSIKQSLTHVSLWKDGSKAVTMQCESPGPRHSLLCHCEHTWEETF